MTHPMPDGNSAALAEYQSSLDKREREIPDGHDVCERCGEVFDEGDLVYTVYAEHPKCGLCVMREQTEYAVLVSLSRQAAAMLNTPEKSVTAHALANRILNWLDK